MTRPNPADESDEMLMALADGELDPTTAERLWTRIAEDPALADRFARFADSRAALRAAYPAEPVPDHLIAAIMAAETPAATVVPFRPRAVASPVRWAMAASVLLAVGLGGFLIGRGLPQAPGGGLAIAAAALSAVPTGGEALLPDGTPARALASFETDLGLCRLIETTAERGLTCRDADGWSVALAVPGAQDDYRPASELGTGLIDAALDQIGAGAALDPAAEAALLDR
ncbi:anti-sigma factor family protein [Paracoccus sp. ME4]|uniref:anti-sigma factor family protein n=1 Tax=Paracoccus sp. ME4 TaxID=3138066 RepID=UPI00398B9A5C